MCQIVRLPHVTASFAQLFRSLADYTGWIIIQGSNCCLWCGCDSIPGHIHCSWSAVMIQAHNVRYASIHAQTVQPMTWLVGLALRCRESRCGTASTSACFINTGHTIEWRTNRQKRKGDWNIKESKPLSGPQERMRMRLSVARWLTV